MFSSFICYIDKYVRCHMGPFSTMKAIKTYNKSSMNVLTMQYGITHAIVSDVGAVGYINMDASVEKCTFSIKPIE